MLEWIQPKGETPTTRTENGMNVTYRVYLTGEYDLDEDGDAYTVFKDFNNALDAYDEAEQWERSTGYVATISRFGD